MVQLQDPHQVGLIRVVSRRTRQQSMPGSGASQWWSITLHHPQDLQRGRGSANDFSHGLAGHSVEHAQDGGSPIWGGLTQRILLLLRCPWCTVSIILWPNLWRWDDGNQVLVSVRSGDQVRGLRWQHLGCSYICLQFPPFCLILVVLFWDYHLAK